MMIHRAGVSGHECGWFLFFTARVDDGYGSLISRPFPPFLYTFPLSGMHRNFFLFKKLYPTRSIWRVDGGHVDLGLLGPIVQENS